MDVVEIVWGEADSSQSALRGECDLFPRGYCQA